MLVWKIFVSRPLFLLAFLETAYLCDPACLSRLLDTLHELKILPQLLAMSHSSFFTLDLASLASRRQHLNLEKWLAKAASDDGEFGQRIAGFLAYRRSAPHAPILSKETIRIFTEFMASKEPMSGGTLKASSMREKRHLPFEHPEHAGTSSDQSDIQFGHEIEDQVNACFEKLFTHEISVGDLLALLAAKRTSVEAADQNFFACLIHNLFDEYRFFPKYPENELLLTASLFGGIINEQLISSVPLSVAFRYILESLKKTPGQKLFKFGIHALYQFQEKLGMWPEFCNYILHTPHLHQTHPELISYIRHCLLSPPGQDAVAQGAGAQEGPVSFLQSGRIDEPDLLLRDKCLFHFNNLAQSNIEKKAGDVHALLWPKYRFWLANNVVVQRVCIEPNLHGLYIDFIDAFPDVAFERCVLDETYAAAHAALALKAEAPTPTERAAFKNLGAWLGLLTLARNRPVLMRELSLKDVLIEAFFGSRLDFVFTFVCKVLEQAADSIVFKPYNPWLMRHLSLLAEFYFFADLKLNMKFEVELLLKAFELDIKDVEPSFYLRALVEGDVPASHRSHAQAPSLHLPGSNVLMKFVNLQVPLLNSMDTNAALELLSYAVDFSAREIATGIADRAVSIARATSGFLASNDLSGYYDAPALESSLVSILTGLTKSLALVTAKEPLRQLLSQNILSFFSSSGASIPEQSVATLVADNLQLACALVVDYSNSTALSQANVLFSKFSVGGQPADLVAGIYSEYFGLIFPMFPGHDLKFKPVSSEEYGSLHHLIESISENAHEASSAAVLTSEAIFANEFGGVIDSLLALGSADVGGASLDEHVSLILARADELIAYHHAQKNDFGMSSCSLILSTLFSHSPSHLDAVFVALLSKIFDICPLQKQDFCRWFLATNSFLSVSPAVSKLFFTKNIFDTLEFDKRLSFKIALDRQLAVDSLRFIEKCISTSAVASIHDFSLCLKAIERLGLISGEFYSKLIQSHASSKFSQSLCTAFFTDWVRIHRFASPSSSCIENYLSRLFCEPILASASNASLFFQNCVEICIEFYARHDADALHAVDAFGLLTALFRRIILAQCSRSQLAALFEHFAVYLKVLGFYFVKCMEQSLDNVAYPIIRSIKSTLFFIDDSPLSEESKTHLLLIFCDFLTSLRPKTSLVLLASYVELSSDMRLLGFLFTRKQLWPTLFEIVAELFKATPLLPTFGLSDRSLVTYRAIIRLLLVVLHDVPDFFVLYHQCLVDFLPRNSIQFRNFVTSAVPKGFHLPNPLSPELKVDLLPEMMSDPPFLSDPASEALPPKLTLGLGKMIDGLAEIDSRLLTEHSYSFGRILMFIAHCSLRKYAGPYTGGDIFSSKCLLLLKDAFNHLELDRKYDLLLCITDQLRFPNRHTHFFSCLLLAIFSETHDISVKEQITRYLRLV